MCTFKNHWTANMKLHLSYFFSPCCAQNYHQNKFWCGTKLPHENMSYGRVPATWKTQLWLFLGKQQDRCVISNQVDLLWEGTFDYFQERTVPNPAGLICLKRKWRLLSSFSVGFPLSEPGYCKLGSVGAHLSLWSWWEIACAKWETCWENWVLTLVCVDISSLMTLSWSGPWVFSPVLVLAGDA